MGRKERERDDEREARRERKGNDIKEDLTSVLIPGRRVGQTNFPAKHQHSK